MLLFKTLHFTLTPELKKGLAEVRFVHAVTAGGIVNFLAAHIVYFVKYDDTVSFMTLYPIQ